MLHSRSITTSIITHALFTKLLFVFKQTSIAALLLFLLLSTTKDVFAEGIAFFNGNWEAAQQMAVKQQKPIFVEVYADWCKPCKEMEKNTFATDYVGNYYNDYFINIRLDVESFEGQQFKATYDIENIPDLLYFDAKGNLMHHVFGKKTTEQMIGIAEEVLLKISTQKMLYTDQLDLSQLSTQLLENNMPTGKETPQQNNASVQLPNKFNTIIMPNGANTPASEAEVLSLESMQKIYDEGFNKPDFLADFAYTLQANQLPTYEVVNKYLQKQRIHLNDMKSMLFVYDFAQDLRNDAIFYLLDEQSWYERRYGVETIHKHIKTAALMGATSGEEALFKKAKKVIKKAGLDKDKIFCLALETSYYEYNNDWVNFSKVNRLFMQNNSSVDPVFLFKKAWDLNRATSLKSDWLLAKAWVEKSIALDSRYENNSLHAQILYQLKEYEGAKQAAQAAIKAGKYFGNTDLSKAESLLSKLGSGKKMVSFRKI